MAGDALSRDLLHGLWCRVCAISRGDFASIDRGYSHEHSAFRTNGAPSCAHDRGYVRTQSRPRISDWSFLRACKRFAAWLGRSPETATPDDVKYFQQHLVESGVSICTRNQTMTGCHCCDGQLTIVETIAPAQHSRAPPKTQRGAA